MSVDDGVRAERHGPVMLITLDRPAVRNAIDPPTAEHLRRAFEAFEADEGSAVCVLTGAGGHFCAGADLAAYARGETYRIEPTGPGPLGPTRLALTKPVIAAISGYAVAGGLELALLCDLRICDETAVFGVFCRRWGVPLIDGGTWRLPQLIGLGRALDLILTGRAVGADEAWAMGLANRVVPAGTALEYALSLARELADLPQACLRADRATVYANLGATGAEGFAREVNGARAVLDEARRGATAFAAGAGRHGRPVRESPDRDPD